MIIPWFLIVPQLFIYIIDVLIVVFNSSLFLPSFSLPCDSTLLNSSGVYFSAPSCWGRCHVTCFGHWNMSRDYCGSSKSGLMAALTIYAFTSCISVIAIRRTHPGWPIDPRRIRNTWNRVPACSLMPSLTKSSCLISQLPADQQAQECE